MFCYRIRNSKEAVMVIVVPVMRYYETQLSNSENCLLILMCPLEVVRYCKTQFNSKTMDEIRNI